MLRAFRCTAVGVDPVLIFATDRDAARSRLARLARVPTRKIRAVRAPEDDHRAPQDPAPETTAMLDFPRTEDEAAPPALDVDDHHRRLVEQIRHDRSDRPDVPKLPWRSISEPRGNVLWMASLVDDHRIYVEGGGSRWEWFLERGTTGEIARSGYPTGERVDSSSPRTEHDGGRVRFYATSHAARTGAERFLMRRLPDTWVATVHPGESDE